MVPPLQMIPSKEVRNWSFGFEGVTSRKIVAIAVVIGTRLLEIILQRSGTGGRVPVEFSSDGYGSDGVTFQPPRTRRLDQPENYSFEDSSDKKVAKLDPTLGRIRPLVVDFDKIASWIKICDQEHEICQHHEVPIDIPQFRLIDVERMCIMQVDALKRPLHATLSYVWGSKSLTRWTPSIVKASLPSWLQKAQMPTVVFPAFYLEQDPLSNIPCRCEEWS
ncbi:hypothetical protein FCULG_00000184 [Fusarium culmorum]|uniref:Heterokaryon incompatibility domain-containing protein n=1 Tax=Fusarium culmorum TaxID=5516 RepID=A0A2T4GQ01_FUSCU|nr:hypothetical protein FCULG_00000184 [Fusarium culmorum]